MATVPKIEDNLAKCVCPTCPTYTADNCAKGKSENLYCATGRTGCTLMEKGCSCGTCPVWEEYKLKRSYYCLRGAAV